MPNYLRQPEPARIEVLGMVLGLDYQLVREQDLVWELWVRLMAEGITADSVT